MSDVFSEVEEEVRRERYMRMARQFGPWVIGLIALVLVGIGGWQLYRGYSETQARDHSTEFAAAQKLLTDGNAKGAAEAFAQMQTKGPAIYREMARMERAAALAQEGDLRGALAGFDAAAAEARDPIVRDTARLRAAYIVADTQDFDAVQARVAPIIESGGPISYLARELLAVEAWEAGEFNLARETFQALSLALEAPESMQQRAGVALQVLGPGAPARQSDAGPAPAGPAQTDNSPPAEADNAPAAPRGESK